MSPSIGEPRARAILVEHGFDPESPAEALTAAIEARGWRVSVEQELTGDRSGRPQRWRALATRPPDPQASPAGARPHLMASGSSARDVLIVVLAQALTQERRRSPHP